MSDPSQREALPAQKLRLEEYAERNRVDGKLYSFDESAFKEDRVKFFAIVEEILSYPKNCIVVFDKIDRFTRDSSAEIVSALKNAVKAGRIELHFPSDGLSIRKDSPAVEWFQLDMGMSLGGYYSNSISDNVKRKIGQKLHDGEYPGKACIGYMNVDITNDDGKIISKNIIQDSIRAPYIKKIFEMRLDGQSFRSIAKQMREDGLSSNTKHPKPVGQSIIENILKNPFYYGVMRYDGKLYPHKYEPIISKQTFDAVQCVNDQRNNQKTKTDTRYKFTFNGLLKCGVCGCSMSSYWQKGHIYIKCSQAKGKCSNHASEADVLPQVYELFDNISITDTQVEQIMVSLKKHYDNIQLFYESAIKETRAQYKKLEDRNSILYEDRLDGRITTDEYDNLVSKNKTEMEKLDEKLVQLTNNDKSFIVDCSYLLKLANRARQLFESSKPEQKNRILKLLLSNLEIKEKRLQPYLLEPFSGLVESHQSSNWLRRPDSNRQPRS